MKNFQTLTAFLILLLIVASSCKKNLHQDNQPLPDESTVTPIGSANGTMIKKTIDHRGGELISADGALKVMVPAEALETAQELSIQPITNELPGGIRNAYRILPHGLTFKKPVKILFKYNTEDLASTTTDFLDIASQNADGSWESNMNPIIDKNNRTLTVTSTHFSDWGFFKSVILTPEEATVELGGNVELKLSTRFPYIDPDDAPPGTQPVKVLRTPRELKPHEVERWSYLGDGILVSRVSEAYYTAPSTEPEANPEAVAAHIHLARKGKFMLISNITVLAGNNVKYLHVDEDYKKAGNDGNCMLYMYGNFGNDPGKTKRAVTINSTNVEVDLWSPKIIRCKIDRDIAGAIQIKSNNKTVATSVLRKYSGNFLYERFHGGKANAGSTKPLKEMTEFKVVYRGFGDVCPPDVDPLFYHTNIAAFGTRADYSLSGQAAVTPPGTCATTTSVSLTETTGTFLHNTLFGSAHNEFLVNVKDVVGGIEIKIEFHVLDVMTGVKVQRSNCNYTSFDTPKSLGVSLEGFSNKSILLSFNESGQLKLKSNSPLKSGNLSSSILIEAWDGTGSPSHYQTDGLVPASFSNK